MQRLCFIAVFVAFGPGCGDGGGSNADTGESSTGGSTGVTDASVSATTPTSATNPTATTPGSETSSDGASADDPTDASADDTSGTSTTGAPMGSAGCGIAGPPAGPLSIDVDGMQGEYVVSIPAGYDAAVPYPLGFAFHGRGRTGPQCQHDNNGMGDGDGDCIGFQSVMESDAVLVYMTSMGGDGWEGDGERELNVAFFEAVLAEMTSGYCIDESKVFAAGTSSGAHFTNILGCRFGDVLVAIAPVAGYLPETENCVDPVAALVIHGFIDSIENGETARDFWVSQNNCSDRTMPTIAEVHAAVMATPETYGCAVYQGCDPGLPVVWCEHSEGGYDGSTHGWPTFGGQQIWDFVSAL